MVSGKKPADLDHEERQPLLPQNGSTASFNDEDTDQNVGPGMASSVSTAETPIHVENRQHYLSISKPTRKSQKGSSVSQRATNSPGENEESAPLNTSHRKVDETKPSKKMPWFDKRKRIILFIAVDSVFFLVEIITGYTVNSLALVADAFHMLNDIISLFVGLWAVGAAQNRASSHEYTYGWVRSEILGGFANGVFLIALCLDLVLEAIKRFSQPQHVQNPQLVLIVGAVGLVSNILGLFVFHQHAHSHGGEHDHAHEHTNDFNTAENGHSHLYQTHDKSLSKSSLNASKDERTSTISRDSPYTQSKSVDVTAGVGDNVTWLDSSPPIANLDSSTQVPSSSTVTLRGRSGSRQQSSLSLNIPVHPASFRNEIIQQARMGANEPDSEESETAKGFANGNVQTENDNTGLSISHHDHLHRRPKVGSKGGHSHSHDDMNMRGIFLHVLGDALGNIGVVASALVIWKTTWPYRHYIDPAISLFITLIILMSSVPLVKEAGRSLLQATPKDVSVDDIRKDILTLPKVLDCHHLHVWALTAQKRVATLDVKLDLDIAKGPANYMELIKGIKQCLREHGVHSSTIQPEFYTDVSSAVDAHGAKIDTNSKPDANGGLGLATCLLDNNETESGKQCCTPRSGNVSGTVTPRTNEL